MNRDRPDPSKIPPIFGTSALRMGAKARPAGVGKPVEVFSPSAVRTSRLMLRDLAESDRVEFLAVVRESAAELERWMPLRRDGEAEPAFFDRMLDLSRRAAATGAAWRRVVMHESGRIIGAVNLNNIARGLTFEADANWWITPSMHRQGFATEAAQAMLDVAFADLPHGLGLQRVNAIVMPENVASVKLCRRLGFRPLRGVTTSLPVRGEYRAHQVFVRSTDSGFVELVD